MALTRQQRAAQDLKEKLRLEESFSLELVRVFNRMADEYSREIEASGVAPSFDNWEAFFEEILGSHYQATADVFAHRIQDQIEIEITEDESDLIASALSVYFLNQSIQSAREINATNQRQAQEAIRRARVQERADFEETGQPYDLPTLAAVSTNIFRTLIFGRVTGIATTETQNAAEAPKMVEADVISYRRPTINDPVPSSTVEQLGDKTWTAILDDVTRETHVKADGQTVKFNGFFIVGGHRMRFPGDKSEAPIEEWINCRCCSIYTPAPEIIRRRTNK